MDSKWTVLFEISSGDIFIKTHLWKHKETFKTCFDSDISLPRSVFLRVKFDNIRHDGQTKLYFNIYFHISYSEFYWNYTAYTQIIKLLHTIVKQKIKINIIYSLYQHYNNFNHNWIFILTKSEGIRLLHYKILWFYK